MNRLTRTLLLLPLLLIALAGGHVHAQEFLDPEEAFKFSARALDAQTIEANWKIADGYYLYKDKFKFALTGAKLGSAQYPAGKVKEDPTFGRVEVYHKSVSIRLPVVREAGGALPVKLEVTYQGCAEEGVCYMPVTSTASLKLAALEAPKAAARSKAPPPLPRSPVCAAWRAMPAWPTCCRQRRRSRPRRVLRTRRPWWSPTASPRITTSTTTG